MKQLISQCIAARNITVRKSYWKKANFTQTWRYNTKVHDPSKRKMGLFRLSRVNFWMVWNFNGIFFLEPTVRKNTWMRTTFVTVTVNFLTVPFWKLLHHSYVQSFFSKITRHIDNSIWETLYSWRFYRMNKHRCKSIMDQHTCKTYVQQNSFLFKHHEMKIDEVVWNCTKIQTCN